MRRQLRLLIRLMRRLLTVTQIGPSTFLLASYLLSLMKVMCLKA
jgi:hypothetical protein